MRPRHFLVLIRIVIVTHLCRINCGTALIFLKLNSNIAIVQWQLDSFDASIFAFRCILACSGSHLVHRPNEWMINLCWLLVFLILFLHFGFLRHLLDAPRCLCNLISKNDASYVFASETELIELNVWFVVYCETSTNRIGNCFVFFPFNSKQHT